MAQTNIINRVREGFQARLRSFVLGEAVVQNWERSWGHESVYTPEEFGDYIIKSNTVYTCATLRAQMLAGLPLKLYKNQTNGKAVEIESGPIYDLFQKVNPHWTWNRMVQQTELSLCLWGKAFWFLERGEQMRLPPQEVWWGKPSRVVIVPHPVDYIERFVYQPLTTARMIDYSPQEVIWFRYPNPLDEFDGLSPIAASRLSADTSVMAMKSNYGIFKNGLSMGGLIVPKTGATPFTPDQAQLLEKQLESRFKGEDKAHRWGVLRVEADIKSAAGITPKEAEFTGLLSMTLEEICRAFKVPLDLIGGQRTYANVESSRMLLWEECLIPEAQFIENEIKEQLLPMFGDDSIYVKFDLDQVPVLQEAKGKEWERDRERIQTNVITINEWRKKQDLEAFAWGDEPYDKIVAEWRSAGGMFGGGADGGDQPATDAPTGTPTNEPPKTEAPTTEPPPPPTPRKAKRAVAGPAYGSNEHRAMLARFDQRVAAKEKALGKVVAEMLRRQQDSVMAALQGRAARGADAVAENPFSKPEWVKKFREAVRPAIRDIVNAAGDSGLEDIGVKVDFKQLDPNVVRFIETRAQRFSVQVNDTTWNKLRDTLSAGIQAGEGADKLAARVTDTMTLRIGQSAENIARTEVVGAENGGMLLSWKQSDIVSGKTWLATMTDGRTRETHVEAHGQTVGIDEDFEVGDGAGPAPGQIGLAEEDCQCFPAQTMVECPSTPIAAMQRQYSGLMVSVKLSSGKEFAGTPNHPVLTTRGWVALNALKEGDYLLGRRLNENPITTNPHPYGGPTTIREVFCLLNTSGSLHRVVGAGPQFHGDGSRGEVSVVSANRELDGVGAAKLSQPTGELGFILPNPADVVLSEDRHVGESILRAGLAGSNMGGSAEPGTLLGRGVSHAGIHGSAAITDGDTRLNQSESNGSPCDPVEFTKGLLGGASEVALYEVVGIKVESFHGYVYNLETNKGAYLVEGIVAHNCRCTMMAVVK